ncbi:hypothetical protein C7M84_022901, partial [Penaeus vannamei]
DRVSRLHYYLQLRDNVVAYTQPISEEATFLLAAYALQADLGDFCEDQHQGHYFDPNLYFPPWVVERVGLTYIMEHAPHMHRDNLGLTQAEAHAQYIREASQQEAPHNLHIYQLRYKKQDPSPQVALAICAKGEEMGPITPSRKLISSFQWSNIGKLSFETISRVIPPVEAGCESRVSPPCTASACPKAGSLENVIFTGANGGSRDALFTGMRSREPSPARAKIRSNLPPKSPMTVGGTWSS